MERSLVWLWGWVLLALDPSRLRLDLPLKPRRSKGRPRVADGPFCNRRPDWLRQFSACGPKPQSWPKYRVEVFALHRERALVVLQRLRLTIWIVFVWTTLGGGFIAANPAVSKAADDEDTEPTQAVEVDSGITTGIPFSPLQFDGYLDVLFAPSGDLDKSGFRLQVGGEGGDYIQGPTEARASFLLGYSFESGDNSLTLMNGVGVQVQDSQFGVRDRAHRLENVSPDWASSAEADTKPTQSTTLNVQASYSTALNEYYSQVDMGYAVAQDMYFGPLVAFLGDDRFQQGRVGGDFSGIKLGSAELGFNAGYLEDLGKSADEPKLIRVGLDSDARHMRDRGDEVNGEFVGADVSVRY